MYANLNISCLVNISCRYPHSHMPICTFKRLIVVCYYQYTLLHCLFITICLELDGMYKNIVNTSSGNTTINGAFWLNGVNKTSIILTTSICVATIIYNINLARWVIISSSNNTGL